MNTCSRSCPLCNNVLVSVVAHVRADQIINSSPYYDDSFYTRFDVRPETAFGISRCQRCSFVFASEVPSMSFLEKLYGSSESVEESVKVFARPARAAYAFQALGRLLGAIAARASLDQQGVPTSALNILDVGCAYGTGSLGLTPAYYPYTVTGIEWSHSTREYLCSQGMTAYRQLEEIPDDTSFDGILLNDVLEHVADPVSFTRIIRQHCHIRTVLWINVPNFTEWRLAEILQRVSSGEKTIPKDLNPWEHLSYFSPATLDAVLGKVGLARIAEPVVAYELSCQSLTELPRVLARTARDIWRLYRGRYPRAFTTGALFAPISAD